jgi:hypothetical protein
VGIKKEEALPSGSAFLLSVFAYTGNADDQENGAE